MNFKIFKRFSIAFSALTLICLMLSYSISAAEIEHITVLGDSISSGYGLSEEERNYGSWLGEYFDAEVENFAANGKTTQQLIDSIESDEDVLESVENSDLICISIGGNDVMDIFYDELVSIANGFQVSQNHGSINISAETIEKLVLSFSTSMGPASAKAGENIGKLADMISQKNPGAKLVFQTVYNPFETNDDSAKGLYTPLYTFTSIYLAAINNAVKNENVIEFADIQSKFKGYCPIFTNIENMDIHPNSLGHLMIAEEIVQKLKIPGKNLLFKNSLNNDLAQNQSKLPNEIIAEISLLADGQFRAEEAKSTFSQQKNTEEELTTKAPEAAATDSQESENSEKRFSKKTRIIITASILIGVALIIAVLIKNKTKEK